MTTNETSLTPKLLKTSLNRLKKANVAFARSRPGDRGDRQPVHVVYGGAHLFHSDSAPKLGALALKSLEDYAPDAGTFAEAVGISGHLSKRIYERVREKLRNEPVEDFRLDFEDGYGSRPDEEEDRDAVRAAQEVARGVARGTLPPFIGVRIKTLSDVLYARSLRTLDIFLTSLLSSSKRQLPHNFVITLPKITSPQHVTTLADALDILEDKLRLERNALKIELMIETPQSVFLEDGRIALPSLVEAGRGRITGAHFGTYDYTALMNVTAAYQTMLHPSCDFAKHVMQVGLAQTGVTLSDGATNVMPVGIHRPVAGNAGLTSAQEAENRQAVHRAWKLHYQHVRHSLETGFYQGWDLHPAQLPTRYAAVYAFFLESAEESSKRLKNFVEKAAQATLVGDVFDDAATGQGLLNYFLRGLNCGAITLEEAQATGLTKADFQSRSFVKILEARKKGAHKGNGR